MSYNSDISNWYFRWYIECRFIMYRIVWLFYRELQVNAAGKYWAEVNRMERVRNQTDLTYPWDNHHHNNNGNNNHYHYNNNDNNNPTNDDKQTKYRYFYFRAMTTALLGIRYTMQNILKGLGTKGWSTANHILEYTI